MHRNKRKQYGAIILTAAFGILRDIINQQTTLLVNVPLAKFDKIFRDITKVLPNKQQLFFQRSLNIYIDDFLISPVIQPIIAKSEGRNINGRVIAPLRLPVGLQYAMLKPALSLNAKTYH